jgi:hypothetical protein
VVLLSSPRRETAKNQKGDKNERGGAQNPSWGGRRAGGLNPNFFCKSNFTKSAFWQSFDMDFFQEVFYEISSLPASSPFSPF